MTDGILDWGDFDPTADDGDGESGWASDTEAEDGKSGLREVHDRTRPHITVHDAESAIEDYAPTAGRVFDATDSERQWVGDDDEWTPRETHGPNPAFESVGVGGTVVSGVVGDSDGYEYLGPIVIGDPTATNVDTMSTAYTQPYNSSYRMVMPNASIADVTGTDGLYLSLTGRFNVVDNSSGSVVSIRAYDISNNTPIAATETDSSAGAGFERFHTERGALVTDTDQLFLGYEIKTSDTQAGLFGPILGHYWRLIA